MMYRQVPDAFNPRFEIASCYVVHGKRFLLLHRQPDKSQGNKWGVPAGKLEKGEASLQGMMRELAEETGLRADPSMLHFIDTVYVRYPAYDFTYHMFSMTTDTEPDIRINPKEHQGFAWTSRQDALRLPLIDDLDTCIEQFCTV